MGTNNPRDDSAVRLTEALAGGRIGRREFVRRATVLGISVPSIGALLAACGSDDDSGSAATTGDGSTVTTAPAVADSSAATTAPSAQLGGTLRIALSSPARELDPLTGFLSGLEIMQNCHDYLVRIDNDFNVLPSIATEWAPSEGAKVWTFKVRSGVRFSDGTPLTAETLRLTYERLVDPEIKSAALSAFGGIFSPGGVAVNADGDLVFTLDRPFSDFPYLCSNSNYSSMILPDDYAGDWMAKPIGSGAFKVDSLETATGARLVRNETYWDAPKPYLDAREYVYYDDVQAAVIGIQSGEVDTLNLLSDFGQARALASADGVVVDQSSSTDVTAFNMRVDTAPFDRKEVRQAIAFALDRPAILERVINGGGALGNDHLIAPAFKAAPTDVEQRALDLAKVQELLGGEKISFTLSYEQYTAAMGQVVVEQLTEAGFDVTPEEMQADVFYGGDQEVDTPWLFRPATLVGWVARPSPSQLVGPMVTSTGVWNSAKYANPALDEAAAGYDASLTDADRATHAHELATILNEDVPVIIPMWGGQARASRTGFTGISAGYFPMAEVAKE